MLRSPGWALTWSILRLAAAALLAAAIVAQAVATIGGAAAGGRDVTTTTVNLFSFFTILSNVVSAVVLAWAGIRFLVAGRTTVTPEPRALATALACATTYMLVTGVVYNTLLRGIELPIGARPIPWSNEVLHVVGPLFLLLDLFLGPRRRALAWPTVAGILVFPIVWAGYTLVRGPLTTNPVSGAAWWYPYPFLDPRTFSNGYVGVAIYVVAIAAVIAAFAALVVWVGRRRGVPAPRPASGPRHPDR